MQVLRAVGREASSKKYDLLSALMAHGLAGDKHRQKLVLRLMALITTRYNWQNDELSIGQAEISRLWSVDERTVKREMAKLRALGWLEQRRAGARGRVALFSLGIERIMLDTRATWDLIGPDFVERLERKPATQLPTDANIVPFHRPVAASEEGIWPQMLTLLFAEDSATAAAWFAPLALDECKAGCVHLLAPSRFHAAYIRTHLIERMRVIARRIDPSISDVRIDS